MATRLPLPGHARHYRLLLFGPFTIYRDGVVVDTGSWQGSAVTLLKLLATAPTWRRSRDELIDCLWPDSAPAAGSSSLRSALHMLRRGLGGGDPSPILYDRGWMELNRAYNWEVDLDTFEKLLRSLADGHIRPEEALALYHDEVLPEHRYDDWAISIRDHTHRLWRDAVLRFVHPLTETVHALALLARMAGETGQPERAGCLWSTIEAEQARAPVGQWEGEWDRFAEPILAHAGPEFEHGYQQGRHLSLSEAVTHVLEGPEVTQETSCCTDWRR